MQELIDAIAQLLPQEVVFEYRVYYDPSTRDCVLKTISEADGPFVVVPAEEYEKIEFCSKYFVTKNGEVRRKPVESVMHNMLQLDITGFATLKNNNIFVSAESNNCDHWSLRLYE